LRHHAAYDERLDIASHQRKHCYKTDIMKLSCCASCGIAEIDDVKLKDCEGCDLVKYCSDECQEIHKSEHEEACKKRAAELRDELLFKLPESSHWGDCPICCLPLSIDVKKSTMYSCCSKVICYGCEYANNIREDKMRIQRTCPFCREPAPKTKQELVKRNMKRVEMNVPFALYQEGGRQFNKGKYQRAFDYFTKAAALGNMEAHFQLALMYKQGKGVEKDKGKEFHHTKEAAVGGHPGARYNLGWNEMNNGNSERAAKHYIIAATQGDDGSIKELLNMFKEGLVEKEELAATLRAYQAAVDATKSPQRDRAEEYRRNR
jgi:hypothetical protein